MSSKDFVREVFEFSYHLASEYLDEPEPEFFKRFPELELREDEVPPLYPWDNKTDHMAASYGFTALLLAEMDDYETSRLEENFEELYMEEIDGRSSGYDKSDMLQFFRMAELTAEDFGVEGVRASQQVLNTKTEVADNLSELVERYGLNQVSSEGSLSP